MTIEILETRIAPALIYAVTTGGHLISFDSAAPGTILADHVITGLSAPATESVTVVPS